jgi:hypothetical protein
MGGQQPADGAKQEGAGAAGRIEHPLGQRISDGARGEAGGKPVGV